MSRLLRIYWYYFSWQRTLTWTTVIGIVLALLAFPVPPPLDRLLIALGACFAVAFPVAFAPVAYRQLIGNRRFMLVPQLRPIASLALLLVAVTATGASMIFGQALVLTAARNLLSLGMLSFTLTSAYLLLSQWLMTQPVGLIGLAVMPIVIIRIASSGYVFAGIDVSGIGPSTAALLGWLWLLLTATNGKASRPLATLRWGSAPVPQVGDYSNNYQWLPQSGPASTAGGSLLRGVNDGWRNRILLALIFLLSVPLTLFLTLYLIGMPFDDPIVRRFGPEFFLIWSYLGLTIHASFYYGEWPARLKLLWLRGLGDRGASWRFMERVLIGDGVLIGGLSGLVAIVIRLLGALPTAYLLLYIAACITMTFLTSYLEFAMRLSGFRRVAKILISLSVALLPLALLVLAHGADATAEIVWALPCLIAAATVLRWIARRRLLRVDWCAVRPLRWARKPS